MIILYRNNPHDRALAQAEAMMRMGYQPGPGVPAIGSPAWLHLRQEIASHFMWLSNNRRRSATPPPNPIEVDVREEGVLYLQNKLREIAGQLQSDSQNDSNQSR